MLRWRVSNSGNANGEKRVSWNGSSVMKSPAYLIPRASIGLHSSPTFATMTKRSGLLHCFSRCTVNDRAHSLRKNMHGLPRICNPGLTYWLIMPNHSD